MFKTLSTYSCWKNI